MLRLRGSDRHPVLRHGIQSLNKKTPRSDNTICRFAELLVKELDPDFHRDDDCYEFRHTGQYPSSRVRVRHPVLRHGIQSLNKQSSR